jgi:DNA-binding NtrC family response regulator
VFEADATLRTLELACQVARSDVPVLVTGPNGSGKERIAAIVHANSAVARGPFVAVNCGALPGDLIEAELFGAESGAYTGANKAREGRFDAADGGTLFLDEIGNLPLSGQIKLLRVLDAGSFQRLGSSQTRRVKVRVLSATNADLKAMVRDGSFREDLFYRLNVIEVRLPPLAERCDDILPLAEHFLAGRATLSEPARDALRAHAWPGNVRELKNVIERAALLAGGQAISVDLLGLPEAVHAVQGTSRSLDEPSRAAVEAALAAAHGVVSRAAQALGMSRQALYRRMERYALPPG